MNCLFVVQFVKDTITTNDNVVKFTLFGDFKGCDIRFRNYNIWISIQLRQLCFNITKSATNGKTTRKYSMRTVDYLLLTFKLWSWVRYDWRVLIYSTSILNNSFHLYFISWLVIVTKNNNFLTIFTGHQCSAISNVCNIYSVIDYYYHNCTWARSVKLSYFFDLLFCKF